MIKQKKHALLEENLRLITENKVLKLQIRNVTTMTCCLAQISGLNYNVEATQRLSFMESLLRGIFKDDIQNKI